MRTGTRLGRLSKREGHQKRRQAVQTKKNSGMQHGGSIERQRWAWAITDSEHCAHGGPQTVGNVRTRRRESDRRYEINDGVQADVNEAHDGGAHTIGEGSEQGETPKEGWSVSLRGG